MSNKRFTDPVHGSIQLTALEADIVNSQSFQRLHNVRQLGLAYYVFPAANYSRFSHSIGACHNAKRILSAIEQNSKISISKDIKDSISLGALLHDLGHYPFSHATEHVVTEYYKDNSFFGNDSDTYQALDHESLGSYIIKNDPELENIFKNHGFTKQDIISIFSKSNPDNNLIGVISSDLDSDRLDYLKRTSLHTGLPYGAVDTDFITSQATLDEDHRFCYTEKAKRAADHVLISRYYDYLQVPFHKTVSALEWSLIESIKLCLEDKTIECTQDKLKSRLEDGSWVRFDDNEFFEKFRALRLNLSQNPSRNSIKIDHIDAIIKRKPAKTLFAYHNLLDTTDKNAVSQYEKIKKETQEKILYLCKKLGIDNERIHFSETNVSFAKYRNQDDAEIYGARILPKFSKKSFPLSEFNDVLFSGMIKKNHKGFRILFLECNHTRNHYKFIRNSFHDFLGSMGSTSFMHI